MENILNFNSTVQFLNTLQVTAWYSVHLQVVKKITSTVEGILHILEVTHTFYQCCGSGIRNLFDPGSWIRDGKIRIRDP